MKFFTDLGEKYKAELIEAIPQGETISLNLHQTVHLEGARGRHMGAAAEVGEVRCV